MPSGSLHPDPSTLRAGRASVGSHSASRLAPSGCWSRASSSRFLDSSALHGGSACSSGTRSFFSPSSFDLLRLPSSAQILIERSWNNAPSLDSDTEIELAVQQQGKIILQCRLVDDLPDALVAVPATHLLRAYPKSRQPALSSGTTRARRRSDRQRLCSLLFPAWPC